MSECECSLLALTECERPIHGADVVSEVEEGDAGALWISQGSSGLNDTLTVFIRNVNTYRTKDALSKSLLWFSVNIIVGMDQSKLLAVLCCVNLIIFGVYRIFGLGLFYFLTGVAMFQEQPPLTSKCALTFIPDLRSISFHL